MTTLRPSCSDEFLGALRGARSVELASYVLRPGRVARGLEAAGDRGADVSVRLERAPLDADGTLAKNNQAIARELAAHHVAVTFTAQGESLHMKAAVVDGRAFLDDRNWPDDAANGARNTILVDTARDDVAVVRSAIAGRPAADAHLWTRKGDALRGEADLLRRARTDRVAVESETFGPGKVARALQSRAEAGCDVRLIVSDRELRHPREAALLSRLAAAGVKIRSAGSDEKMALAGRQAWVGSANATAWPSDAVDWGMRTRAPAVVAALAQRFEANWSRGRAFAAASE